MTGRRSLAVAGVAVLAAVLIGWTLLRPATTGDLSTQPIVELRVNEGRKEIINRGAPVTFTVTVTAMPAARLSVGSRWRPWYRQIHLETADGQTPAWLRVDPSPAYSRRIARTPQAGLDVSAAILDVAPLDAGHVHTATFEIPAESTASLTPGRLDLRAVLEAPSWMFWTWRGRVNSVPVTLEVRDADPGLEAARLSATISDYLKRRRYADAKPLAEALVQREPTRAGPYELLGRVLEGLNDRPGAIAAYTRALQLMRRTYEEPVHLLDRVGRLTNSAQRASAKGATGPSRRSP